MYQRMSTEAWFRANLPGIGLRFYFDENVQKHGCTREISSLRCVKFTADKITYYVHDHGQIVHKDILLRNWYMYDTKYIIEIFRVAPFRTDNEEAIIRSPRKAN